MDSFLFCYIVLYLAFYYSEYTALHSLCNLHLQYLMFHMLQFVLDL